MKTTTKIFVTCFVIACAAIHLPAQNVGTSIDDKEAILIMLHYPLMKLGKGFVQ